MRLAARVAALGMLAGLLSAWGCGDAGGEGPPPPPEIRYGDSVCAACNMIISDERFATATVVRGDRGHEALLFDDFNCQIRHETSSPDLAILARWVHDHGTRVWIDAESAHYVRSPNLRTPMASNIAAFAARDGAEAMVGELTGDLVSFEGIWKSVGLNGCCSQDAGAKEDTDDAGNG